MSRPLHLSARWITRKSSRRQSPRDRYRLDIPLSVSVSSNTLSWSKRRNSPDETGLVSADSALTGALSVVSGSTSQSLPNGDSGQGAPDDHGESSIRSTKRAPSALVVSLSPPCGHGGYRCANQGHPDCNTRLSSPFSPFSPSCTCPQLLFLPSTPLSIILILAAMVVLNLDTRNRRLPGEPNVRVSPACQLPRHVKVSKPNVHLVF